MAASRSATRRHHPAYSSQSFLFRKGKQSTACINPSLITLIHTL